MRHWTATLLLLGFFSLAACSSGGGNDEEALNDDTESTVTTEEGEGTEPNEAPEVSLAVSATATAGEQISLNAVVSDDGLPDGTLSYIWRKESGEGDVSFSPADAATTSATFSRAGEYTVVLEVSDGELSSADSMVVSVMASNVDPSGLDSETTDEAVEDADSAQDESSAEDESDTGSDASESDSSETETSESEGDTADASDDVDETTDASEEVDKTTEETEEQTPDSADSGTLYHSSGLSLVFDPEMIALTQDDLDWMYRVWEGMKACQVVGQNAAVPEIRIVDSLGGEHNYDYTLSPAKVIVPVSDVFYGKGATQGLALAKGFAAYMGNTERDGFDPHDVTGYTCYDWHSGGRHNPPPGRSLMPVASAEATSVESFSWSGVSTQITSDGVTLSAEASSELASLAAAVLSCNRQFAYTLDELRVVPSGSSFEGDYWDADGAFAVEGGGTVVVGYDGDTSATWKRGVFDLLNRYAVSKIDHRIGYYECLDPDSRFYSSNPLNP